VTGVSSSTFADGAGGAQARFALQNAQGGINGHPIKLVAKDDQSSPSTNQTAAQDLVSADHVFGVIEDSAFTYGAARYLNQQGVPVTGGGFDGTEWPMYSNMFATIPLEDAPVAGVYYSDNTVALALKQAGVTKLAGLGYGIGFSSPESIRAAFVGAQPLGVSKCYENLSVPFGGVDFTADVLQIKSAGCDGVVGSFVDNSDVALSQAVKNAGLTDKQMYFTAYDQSVLDSPSAEAALNGDYFRAQENFTTPNAATQQMLNALKQYDPAYKGGIPDFGLAGAYLAADLIVKGLQMAGPNPTPKSFITNLRTLSSYDAGGILSSPTSFAGFGTSAIVPQKICMYYLQLQGTKYVALNSGQPICGQRIVAPSP
jgi:branched-chain amino acid transport system substrate-binding protein